MYGGLVDEEGKIILKGKGMGKTRQKACMRIEKKRREERGGG